MRPISRFMLRCGLSAAIGALLLISSTTTAAAAGVRDRGSDQALRAKIAAITEANRQAFSAKSGRATLVVTSDADLPDDSIEDGILDPPTLRAAIENANYFPGADDIQFGPLVTFIQPTTALPLINDDLTIDGAYGSSNRVIIDGSLLTDGLGTAEYGLTATGATLSFSHLEIRNFPDGGISLTVGTPNTIIAGCLIHDNDGPGINGNSLVSVLVGGPNPGDRNYIYNHTGTGGNGISFFEGASITGSNNCMIVNNYIGTTNGSNAAGNSRHGIRLNGSFNTIADNVIIANEYSGILLGDDDQVQNLGNVIESNLIGLIATGTDTLGNGASDFGAGEGIRIEYSQGDTIRFNDIAGNAGGGLEIAREETFGLHFHDNNVGRNIAGDSALGNRGVGVLLRGHSHLVENNTVSGSIGNGIACAADSSIVRANVCGTDNPLDGDMSNSAFGITVQGHENMIGGPAAIDRNVASGNGNGGLGFTGFGGTYNNTIQNNYFGLDATGNVAIPNGSHGIAFTNGISHNTIIENTISGNGLDGINMDCNAALPCDSNTIIANFIGLNTVADDIVPNLRHGIFLSDARYTQIGGATIFDGNEIEGNLGSGVFVEVGDSNSVLNNIIENNDGDGVTVDGGMGHTVRFNDITANGGLGIDLFDDGADLNDSLDLDIGPNNFQNYPEIDTFYVDAGQTIIDATLWSVNGLNYIIDLYLNDSCDVTGFGEGDSWQDSITVTTDVDGYAAINFTLNFLLDPAVDFVTMTATDEDGNTSEFSLCYQPVIDSDSADIRVVKTADRDSAMVGDTVIYTVDVLNAGPDPSNGVAMIDTLPVEITFVDHAITLGGGSCTVSNSVLTCLFGTMPVSDIRTVEITGIANAQGTPTNRAVAAGDALELNIADNADTAVVTVTAPTDVSELDTGLLPTEYALSANYPNPFNPATSIEFALPESGRVTLLVYDLLGRNIRTLVNERLPAGSYRVDWDGRSDQGETVASGVYFYRMEANGFVASKKMLLLK